MMNKTVSFPNRTPAPAGDTLVNDIRRHISFTLGNDPDKPSKYACYMGLAYSVRDRLIERPVDMNPQELPAGLTQNRSHDRAPQLLATHD